MDAKTLEKMTLPKLRDEALKFDDLTGVHGMDKDQLLDILKDKYGVADHHTESDALKARKRRIKQKIKQLKAQKAQAIEEKDQEKTAFLRRRLRRQRRILKKVETKAQAAA